MQSCRQMSNSIPSDGGCRKLSDCTVNIAGSTLTDPFSGEREFWLPSCSFALFWLQHSSALVFLASPGLAESARCRFGLFTLEGDDLLTNGNAEQSLAATAR